MKKIAKISKFLLVLVLITGWIFSGFPQIFNFPPEVQQAQAETKTIILNYTQTILTEGTTWTVPADWTNANNTIEVIGGGGTGFTDTTGVAGMGGGGGGAYSKKINLTLTPGATVTYQIGVGGKNNAATGGAPNGGDTFFNRTAGSAGTCADTTSVCAKGGTGATSATGGAGGVDTSGTGDARLSGGAGGAGNATADSGGGGGGAGGPNVAGKTGGNGYTVGTGGGGGGGGGNGGTLSGVGANGTTAGVLGGVGDLGSGAGAAGGAGGSGGNGTASGAGGGSGDTLLHGGNGYQGTNLSGGVGPGGGGGGGGGTSAAVGVGGNGGLYGGGGGGNRYGGEGAPGVIVITYNGGTATKTTWKVPTDWNNSNNSIEVIGGGGSSWSAAQGAGIGGGGGGAYSKSVNQTLTPGGTVTYALGAGGRKTVVGVGAGVNGGDTYFCNSTTNCATIAGTAVVAGAKGGLGATSLTGAVGGAAASGFAYGTGNAKWSGGAGGTGNNTGDSGGGGGGAAGSSQDGKAGGIGYTSASGGGGGGGGAGDNSGTDSTVGGAGVAANGGAGGYGPTGAAGGSGAAGANTFGGDAPAGVGAGGGGGDTPFAGGEGGSGSATTYGGGGGGGVGDSNLVATGALFGGDGGLFGAGGGGGLIPGFGANGVIIITYTPNAPPTVSISQPDGVGDTIAQNGSYTITYALADTDDVVTAALYYDTDAVGYNGTAIAACSAVTEAGTTCVWDTTGVAAGAYYIYASTTDSVNAPVQSAYSGALTIEAVVISVSITSDGFVEYGYVPLSGTKSTIELPDTQNATNSGNVTEKFNIKTSNATSSSSTWTLGSATGTQNVYIHEFATSSGWVKFAAADSYQRLVEGVTQNSSQNFDLRIGIPSSVSDYEQKTIYITIQATQ